MSRQAIKAINWAALAEKVPETEKAAFAAFKSKSDQYLRRMNANPETPAKIDWAYYKKNIAQPAFIDKLQKEYESFKVPYPVDKYTSLVEAQEKTVHAAIEKFIRESNERIEQANNDVTKIKSLLPFSEMTMDDFRDMYPDEALDAINKPTAWPHTAEVQPENEAGRPTH